MLLGLLDSAIREETPELREQGVRIRLLGRLEELPADTRASITEALAATADGDRLMLNVAFNYSGRHEIVDAARRCLEDGLTRRRDRRGRHRRAPVHGRAAAARPADPDRPRAPHQQLPHLAGAVRRALLHRPALAGLRAGRVRRGARRLRATPPSLRALTRSVGVRQRAISAVILVPVLLIVLWLGGFVLAGRGSRSSPSSRRSRSSGSCAPRATRRSPPLGRRPRARASCSTRRSRRSSRAAACSLGAVGIVLVAVAAFTRLDPHEGLATWMATIFGALYVSLLSFVIRLGHVAPAIPRAPRSRSRRRAGLDPRCSSCRSGRTTPARTSSGKQFGRQKFLTHISPSKTYAGLVGGIVATTVVIAVALWAVGPAAVPRAPARAADRARGAGRRPRRVRHQARGRGEGLRRPDPGPRRDARPRRLVPLRGPGRDPVCRRRPRLRSARRAGVALIGSTGSIGRQTVDVLEAHPEAFRVVALAAGTNQGVLDEQVARLRPAVSGPRRIGRRPRGSRHPRRRRPRRHRDGRRRQPAPGPRGPRGRQGRRHGQQGDAGRGWPPRHARGAAAGRGGRRAGPR